MGKTKVDIVDELEELNEKLGEDEQIEFDPEDTNKNLEKLLKKAEEKVADAEAEADVEDKDEPGEEEKDDPEKTPKPEKKPTKGKFTITTCNGKPYPSAENPKVFDTLEEAQEEAKFIKGKVDK